MSKDLKTKTFKGFFWLLVGSSSQSVLQILVLSILARLISPEEFGVISIAIVFLGFSKIVSQLGMGAAIIQKETISYKHIRTAFTVSLAIGILFCVITIIFSTNIALFFNMEELSKVLRFVSCIFIVDSFISISQSLLQRNLKMKQFALTDFISYVIAFGFCGVPLAFLGYGLYALVYAYIIQAILRALMVSYLQPHSILPYFNKKCFSDLVFFGGGHTVARIANYIANQADNLVVGKMLDASALGFYSRAYQLMVTPVNLIGQSLNVVLFPALASVQTDMTKVKKAYYKSIQLVAYASLLISVILFVNAREIVLILLGDQWLEVVVPFQILATGTLFRMSYKIGDSLIKALGDVYRRALFQVIYATCVILFAYIGHYWGITGVAYGVLAAIFINFVFITYLSLFQFRDSGKRFLQIHLKPLLLSSVVFLFAYFVLNVLKSSNLNIIIIEIIYLALTLSFTSVAIIKFRRFLEVSEEVGALLKQLSGKSQ